MKRILTTATVLAVSWAGAAQADDIDPSALNYGEYGELETALTASAGDPANGRVIMASRSLGNCIACHMTTDLEEFPFHGDVGPTLDGAGERWSEAELRGIVSNAKLTFADSMMPSFYKNVGYIRPGDAYTGKAAPETGLSTLLTAQQIEDVVAYLMTLKES
jgi:sulfur-oxidizing protein SoxX